MTFELPTVVTTSAELRDLEQNAPNVTPKRIRAALVNAAKLIEAHEKNAAAAARIIEEALSHRVSQMDSPSRAIEIDRAVKHAMHQALGILRS